MMEQSKSFKKMKFLFENTDEDPVIVEIASATLSQVIAHNVIVLNEKLSQAESDNNKLKFEIISLKA